MTRELVTFFQDAVQFLEVAPPAPLVVSGRHVRDRHLYFFKGVLGISLTVLRRGVERQAHVVLLADQNDEDRLFQVQAILWCMVSMQIYCSFQQYGVQPRDDEKKKVSWQTSRRVHTFADLKRA